MAEVSPLDEAFWEAVRAERPRDEDLRVFRKWDEYIELVARVEAHPRNQPGADKSSVEKSDREVREHYAKARRLRGRKSSGDNPQEALGNERSRPGRPKVR